MRDAVLRRKRFLRVLAFELELGPVRFRNLPFFLLNSRGLLGLHRASVVGVAHADLRLRLGHAEEFVEALLRWLGGLCRGDAVVFPEEDLLILLEALLLLLFVDNFFQRLK